ncbi:regulator of nonsense transcripts 2 isoform X2 [Leguminivora glycinivorella]|uniref:regulator of nonsense transcripts 2 isoform X2 n=1 Tax=Leguminivora glycinivorella TaxID=1035111 RepID=UPI00200BF523|nr:regulator of nonsense transcripts 2 isoform X2 [Leguminivora glycinivorella]
MTTMSAPENESGTNCAADETAENTEENDKLALAEYISGLEARIKQKTEMRNSNLNCVRPPDNHFSKLDSGLKKNTTFVKKLKSFSAIQMDALLKDFSVLNLTKYISEVAAAIAEAKLKMSDIPAAINLCSALHRTYSEFSSNFFENWQKLLKVTDKITNSSKLRVDIRFYAELVAVGVFPNKIGLPLLGNVLTVLINMDKEEPNNIPILLSFCKHCGEDYAGLVPKKIKDTAEKLNVQIPRNTFLPAEKQAVVRQLLKDYFATLLKHLMEERTQLQALHAANQRTLHTRGELSQERKDQLEHHQATYDKLLAGAQSFAEVLGEELGEAGEPPTLSMTVIETPGTVTIGGTEEFNMQAGTDPWQDEDTRTFYTHLPDLKVFMPNYQLKETTKSKTETVTEEMLDEDLKEDELSDSEEPAVPDVEDDHQPTSVSNKYALDAFLNELPNCINRELIDNAAVDFVLNLNTKNNRKKLTRVLFSVARTRLDLLPFYSRFAANLYPVLPDVCIDLCQMLKQDFKYHVRKKDQINIESKIKVVRFIGELVKFGLYSKMEALYCLKVLLHDFKHHHIEMACNLLETCGRYLYCNPDTHQRTMIYLQQMMRKKTVSALDSRYVTQIENAFYYVCPPEAPAQPKEEEPPMHQFIRKILHEDLQKSNEEKIFRLMRKINWEDPEIAAVAIQHLAGGWRVRASARRALARMAAELAAWQEMVAPCVVDTVLEDIRATLEDPHPRHNQRRIATVRYLGELYNYKLLDSRDVFTVLYSFITFGVTNDHALPSPLDPPDNVFRIRLVCALLETCGAYFNSGSSKKRLDYFLIFFQHYYWFKCSDPVWTEEYKFPIYVKYIYQECLMTLRPKLTLFTDWQQCKDAIEELRQTLYPELGEEEYDNEDQGDDSVNDGLDTIIETDDETDNPQLMDESSDDEPLTENAGAEENEVHSDDNNMSNEPRRPAPKPVEDVEFESAFEKMVMENIAERQRENRPQQRDIAVPMTCRQTTKKTYDQLLQGEEGVEFVLMVRKGTKPQYKSFNAPPELASNLQQQALADKQEKERVKRLTLNISERQEEEEYSAESGGGSGGLGNPNRGQHVRQKYQHPKGAPDADLIFGPKKFK